MGKLSDVMKAVIDVSADMDVELNSAVTIVDAAKCKMYMKNFGEFFNNQIESARDHRAQPHGYHGRSQDSEGCGHDS